MKDVIRRTQGRDQAPICMHYVMRSPIPSRVDNEAEVGDGKWLCPAEWGERLFREPPV